MPGVAVVDIRNSYGAGFIGLLVSAVLLGVLIVQAWIYNWRYWNKDQKAFKIFVGFLVIMETIHTVICAVGLYWYLVLNFGNAKNLAYNYWALNVQVLISAISSSGVQLFYARRIYLVSESLFIPIIVVAFVIGGNCLTIFLTARNFAAKRFSESRIPLSVVASAMSLTVLVDILIAATMCWNLYRKRTGFARTDSIIMTLMAYTLHSGLLTSALGTAMTISFAVARSSFISTAFFWAMSKCYVNSLLAMLNSRDHVRDRSTTDHPETAYNLSSLRIEPPSETYGTKSRQTGVSVTVHHHTTTSGFGQSKSDHKLGPTFETVEGDEQTTFSN